MSSRVAYSGAAAVRCSVQLAPDLMAEKRFEDVGQLYPGSRESMPLGYIFISYLY